MILALPSVVYLVVHSTSLCIPSEILYNKSSVNASWTNNDVQVNKAGTDGMASLSGTQDNYWRHRTSSHHLYFLSLSFSFLPPSILSILYLSPHPTFFKKIYCGNIFNIRFAILIIFRWIIQWH